jgi:hypothetical protein
MRLQLWLIGRLCIKRWRRRQRRCGEVREQKKSLVCCYVAVVVWTDAPVIYRDKIL